MSSLSSRAGSATLHNAAMRPLSSAVLSAGRHTFIAGAHSPERAYSAHARACAHATAMLRRTPVAADDDDDDGPVTLLDGGGTWSAGAHRVRGTDAVVPHGSRAVVRLPHTRRQRCVRAVAQLVVLAAFVAVGYVGGHAVLDTATTRRHDDSLPWQRALARIVPERQRRHELRDDELRVFVERVHREDRLGHHNDTTAAAAAVAWRNDSAALQVHRERVRDDPLYAELFRGTRSTAGLRRLGALGAYRLELPDPAHDTLSVDTRGDELHATVRVLVAPPLYAGDDDDPATVPPVEHRWLCAVRGPELTVARHVRVRRRSPHAEEYELGVTVTRPGRYELDLAVLLPPRRANASRTDTYADTDAERVVPVFRRVRMEVRGRAALEQEARHTPACTMAWAPGRWLRATAGYLAAGDGDDADPARRMDAWLRGDVVFAPYHCTLRPVLGADAHECLRRRGVDGVVVRGGVADGGAELTSALLDVLLADQPDARVPDAAALARRATRAVHAVVDGVYVGWLRNTSLTATPYATGGGDDGDAGDYVLGRPPLSRPAARVLVVQLGAGDPATLRQWTRTLPDVRRQLWWGDEPLWQRDAGANASAALHWRVWPRVERWHRTLYEQRVQVLGTAALEEPLLYAVADVARRRALVWRQAAQLWWAAVCADV